MFLGIDHGTSAIRFSCDRTEWKVPLGGVTGVNLARVKKMYLGVGDRKAPVAGGAGRIYIDDIRVTKP